MEDRLRQRILGIATELAREEKAKLDAAGGFVDLERLTVEIGDELTRQLTGVVLSSRSEDATQQAVHPCPSCGQECSVAEAEPLILNGMRGEVEYSEPQCFCPRCRRAFFPGGEGFGASPA